MGKKYRSEAMAAVHETMEALAKKALFWQPPCTATRRMRSDLGHISDSLHAADSKDGHWLEVMDTLKAAGNELRSIIVSSRA